MSLIFCVAFRVNAPALRLALNNVGRAWFNALLVSTPIFFWTVGSCAARIKVFTINRRINIIKLPWKATTKKVMRWLFISLNVTTEANPTQKVLVS